MPQLAVQDIPSFSTAIVTQAQSGAYSSCGSLQHYIDEHPRISCYIYGDPCSGMSCNSYGLNGTHYVYVSFTVQKCEDPVTVYTYGDVGFNTGHYLYFSYEFNKSETVDTYGYGYDYYYEYDYGYDHNLSSYTAILDRNASHLGFEVYTCTCMYIVNVACTCIWSEPVNTRAHGFLALTGS